MRHYELSIQDAQFHSRSKATPLHQSLPDWVVCDASDVDADSTLHTVALLPLLHLAAAAVRRTVTLSYLSQGQMTRGWVLQVFDRQDSARGSGKRRGDGCRARRASWTVHRREVIAETGTRSLARPAEVALWP